jgi:hypothetical protein
MSAGGALMVLFRRNIYCQEATHIGMDRQKATYVRLITLVLATLLTLRSNGFSGSSRGQSERNVQRENSSRSYRLLASGADRTGTWYVVSLAEHPSVAATKALVCEVVRQEMPVNYRVLSISFYVGLDSWIAPVGHGDTEIDRKQNEHWIAHYIWNVDPPKSKTRLFIVREHRFWGFDHLKDCKS